MTQTRDRCCVPLLALSAGIALALSGCSGAGLTDTSPANPDPASTSAIATSPVMPSQAPRTAAPTATLGGSVASPSAAAVPLAGADFIRTGLEDHRAIQLRFDVISLARQGRLVELTASVTNLESAPRGSGDISTSLAWNVDGLSDRSRGTTESRVWTAYSGTTLVDVASKKRYLVAVDSRGACLCTPELTLTPMLWPGASLTLNAAYAAPPATTTKVTVDVPGIGSFAGVPIS